MQILVQKGQKRFLLCPGAKNRPGLIRNISPMNVIMTLKFEGQVEKGVISWSVKVFLKDVKF